MGLVLEILNDIRSQIAADEKVLKEAQDRRNLAAEGGMEIDGALRWFRSGSVAHGTVNKPVTDADSGLVLDRRNERYAKLGPDGEGEGPDEVCDEVAQLVGDKVRSEYPKAKVKQTRRGICVEYNEPLNDNEDPSVDLIVTLTRKDDDGLWIPDRDDNSWSASHPEKHTELFTGDSRELRALRARVARLAKAWNKQFDEGDRPLSSFNIVALAHEYIKDSSVSLDKALAGWFRYAHDEIEKGPTEDPAGVSKPIRLLLDQDIVVKRLGSAADRLEHALDNEDDENAVRDDLATVFPDYVEPPEGSKSELASALRGGNTGVGVSKVGVVVGGGTALKKTRPYGVSNA
jgi:Second Messenger Oligonucleotide or Dinucleotide Synthetase domain